MRAVLIKTLINILALLPLPALHKLGSLLGHILYKLPNATKLNTTINIQHCFPDKTRAEQDEMIKKSLQETAKTLTETCAFWCWPKEKLVRLLHETPSSRALRSSIQNSQAAIILTPHTGAWELVGMYCAQLKPITVLYRPPRQMALDPIIYHARKRLGIELAATDQNGIRALSRALKKHQLIGILPDQDPGKNGGIFAPFFDKPANTMTLVSRLAAKAQCPVFCIYAERLDHGQGYAIHCIEAPSILSNGNPEESVTSLNKMVEACIAQAPTQYQWGYKRFKNQPEGMPDIYKMKINQ